MSKELKLFIVPEMVSIVGPGSVLITVKMFLCFHEQARFLWTKYSPSQPYHLYIVRGRIFSPDGNKLGASSFLFRNGVFNDFPIPRYEQACSQIV